MLYLKNLTIENVRCFGPKQQIDFTCSDGEISQWTVILGDNGTGKTTLLRSIVSLLPAPQSFLYKRSQQETGYDLSMMTKWINYWSLKPRKGEKPSSIDLTAIESRKPFGKEAEYEGKFSFADSSDQTGTSIKSIIASDYDTKLYSPVYCFAYGASRKMGTKSLSGDNLLRANDTLFDEEALLQNSEEYFLQIDYETAKQKKGSAERDKIKDLLLRILPSGVKDIRVSKKGHLQREVQVKTPYGWVGLNDMSLGYKTTMAWLVDFATKMMYYHSKSSSPFDQPAILIIDEIDLHMHPSWQKEIVSKLTEVFPNTQFIVTAHSPLVAQAALDSNLVLLKRNKDHVQVINEPEVIKNWRVDQILTSDLFGLDSARPDETSKLIEKRDRLLRKANLTDHDKKRIDQLDKKIGYIPFGETAVEIKADTIIKTLAQKLKSEGKI